jgi:long-chain acyl-CoA synthetase
MTNCNDEAVARPWRLAFPTVANWDKPIEISTIPALFDRAVAANADLPVIEFRDRHIGYRALGQEADQLAAGLLQLGIGRGEAVGLLLPNTPWHPVSFFAVARTGARIVHLSPLDSVPEHLHKLADSGARTLITTNLPGILPQAIRALEEGRLERVLIAEDDRWGESQSLAVPWSDRIRKLPKADPPAAWPELSPDDVCLLQYTGGTTGHPKGAMLTHGNLTAAVASGRAWAEDTSGPPGTERLIGVLPFFHIYALTTLLLARLADGQELMLRQRFEPAILLDDIHRKRATRFAGVPTMWIALVNHPGVEGCDFSSLRACYSGGAPLPMDTRQRVERLVGRPLLGGWGMTETAPAGTRIPHGAVPAPGLIGIPLPGIDMCIVDRDDPSRKMPPGEAGEIAIRGANVFRGYWNKPEDTAAVFHDGWFLTGDLGFMDERGLFSILDRKKNMIISSGFNVYPAAIENAIHKHPDVMEAIVIGVPDPYRGQAAKAFVTLRPGAPPLTLEELKNFLTDRVGRHEMPAVLEVRDSLPRSPVGKLLPRVLIEEETAKLRAGTGRDRPTPG